LLTLTPYRRKHLPQLVETTRDVKIHDLIDF
jgi:hypothetical protein